MKKAKDFTHGELVRLHGQIYRVLHGTRNGWVALVPGWTWGNVEKMIDQTVNVRVSYLEVRVGTEWVWNS